MNKYTYEAYTYFTGNVKTYNRLQVEAKENQIFRGEVIDIIYLYFPCQYETQTEDIDSKMTLEKLLDCFSEEYLEEGDFDLWIPMEGDLLVCKNGKAIYRIDIVGYTEEEWEAECKAEGIINCKHYDYERGGVQSCY